MKKSRLIFFNLALSLLAGAFAPAVASAGMITPNGSVGDKGTGFGAELYVLGLQAASQATTEWGSVFVDSTSPYKVDATTGPKTHNQSTTRSVTEMTAKGIDQTNLAFIFNINQEGANLTLHLKDFYVKGYSATGTELFSSRFVSSDYSNGNPNGVAVLPVANGQGAAGWVFDVKGVDSGISLATFFQTGSNRIGITIFQADAINTEANDGPESFYVTRDNFNVVNQVPEPTSMALIGFGVLGMAGYGWRRRRQAATQSESPATADA